MSELKIALLGAPGTGKSPVARELVAQKQYSYCRTGGNSVEQTAMQAVGPFGSYREDFWSFFETLHEEQESWSIQDDTVTTGTGWHNLAHAAVNLDILQHGLQTPSVQEEIMQRLAALPILTMLVMQNFPYNYVFRLPYVRENQKDEEWEYNKKIDLAIQAILDGQGLRIQTLAEGTPDEQAQEILATIEKHGIPTRAADDSQA